MTIKKMQCVLIASILAVVFAANHQGLTVEEVAKMIFAKMDNNYDGSISAAEMDLQFVDNYDHDKNGCVSKHEFMHQWNHDYHDDHHATEKMFELLNIDDNECLNKDDLHVHEAAMDTDKDGSISETEFIAFMHHVHPDSVGHGHHGR